MDDVRLPGEDDTEEETEALADAEFNVGILEDLRTELADRVRQTLGLPEAAAASDTDIEFVLMYLASCADQYISDQGMASDEEYTTDVALNDLGILSQSIGRVASLVRRVEIERGFEALRRKRRAPIKLLPPVTIDTLRNMSELQQHEYAEAMRLANEKIEEALKWTRPETKTTPVAAKPEIQVIRRKRGA